MTNSRLTALEQWAVIFRNTSMWIIMAMAVAMTCVTLLAAIGTLPWLQVQAGLGSTPIPNAGMWLQVALTVLAVTLCLYLPANRRMAQLEDSHRDFQITMDDVTRAYVLAHSRDREGVFNLSSEFDGVRQRLAFLRDHPDLRLLEPDVLEVAAQMSEKSRELASIYSDDKVDRARMFLQQRQEEASAFDERLKMVRRTLDELKRWNQQLNVEDGVRQQQLDQLEVDLFDLLPQIGYEVGIEKIDPLVLEEEIATRKPNVVSMTPKTGGNVTP